MKSKIIFHFVLGLVGFFHLKASLEHPVWLNPDIKQILLGTQSAS